MINLKVFDPFERVGMLLCNLAASRDCSKVQFALMNHAFEISAKDFGKDFSLGMTVSDRECFLKASKVVGTYKLMKGAVVCDSGSLIINNCLVTDSPAPSYCKFEDKTVVNGFLSDGRRICYPEALTTTGIPFRDITKGPFAETGSIRPFYQYFVKSFIDGKGGEIVIHGPAALPTVVMNQTVDYNGRQFSIGSIGVNGVVLNNDVFEESVEKMVKAEYGIMLRYGRTNVPFVFGQSAQFIDGKDLTYLVVEDLLALICYVENTPTALDSLADVGVSCEDNMLQVDLILENGRFVLSKSLANFIDVCVANNSRLARIFDHIIASRDKLCISSQKGIGVLSSNGGSQSCFFMSYAMLISQISGSGLTNYLEALISVFESDFVKLTPYGNYQIIVGNSTYQFERKPVEFVLDERLNKKVIANRITSPTMKEKGLAVMGWDKDPSNDEPFDHYIVVQCDDSGKVSCYYDPYQKDPIPVGTDVSGFKNPIFLSLKGRVAGREQVALNSVNISTLGAV